MRCNAAVGKSSALFEGTHFTAAPPIMDAVGAAACGAERWFDSENSEKKLRHF